MSHVLPRRTGMMSALCSRFLILAFSVAVMVVNTSGQTSSKKSPPKKAPVKPNTSAAGSAAQSETPSIKFEKYTLPNGLVVILSEDHRLPLVSTNIWYHVGPANELPGRTGFAHLFEHMMFEGSKHVPGNAHIRLLDAAGAADFN